MTHYLVTAIVDFIVALVALSKKDNSAAKSLSFACFCLGLWSLELYLLTVVQDLDVLSIAFHLTRWGMFFIPPSLALLSWMLIGARSKLFFNVVVLPGLLVSGSLSILNAFFFPSELSYADGGYLPKLDLVFYAFAINFLYCLIGSVIATSLIYRSATYREKQRVKWLLIILSMTLVTGLVSILLVQYDFYLKLVGATTNITFVCLLFYSTVQHHLMDVRLAISVGLARAVLLAGVIWSFFFMNSVLGGVDQSLASVLVTLLFIVVVLEVYPRALRWLLPNAKKLMQRQAYDFDEVVNEYGKALNNSISEKELVRITEVLFNKVTRVKSYCLFMVKGNEFTCLNAFNRRLDEEQKDILLECLSVQSGLLISDEAPPHLQKILCDLEANACFAVKYEGQTVGVALIGSPLSQAYYRYDDIRIFEWLCVELGQVLNRIIQLDEMHNSLGQAKKTLSMLGVMNHYHHDIKAPLAIIDGVLSNDIYDKEKQKDIVLEQVERGSKLITTMANILKGERKRKVTPISIQEVVQDSVFLFSQGIDNLKYEFADVPPLMADAEDLKILVINVIKNAIEAKRKGSSLNITATTTLTESHVMLSIADTGKGIPAELLDSIWEEAESDKEGGSGIGMQAIKRIADEHYAEVEVLSELNVGSEFIFKFPISLLASPENNENEDALKDTSNIAVNIKKM